MKIVVEASNRNRFKATAVDLHYDIKHNLQSLPSVSEIMAKKTIKEYSVEELRAKLKTLSSMCVVLLCIYGFLLITMLVYCWMRNWEVEMQVPLIVIFIGGMTTLLPLFTSRGAFAKELKNRNESKINDK